MRQGWVRIAVAIAVIGVIGVIVLAARLWRMIGGAGISWVGWLALVLGALLSLGVGIGLMALIIFSNRQGYDELGRDDRDRPAR